MARFDPYLNFSGKSAEAMRFYETVFGGKLEIIRFSDFPGGDEGVPASERDLVMHASLSLDDGRVLMASDVPSSMSNVTSGSSSQIMIGVDAADEARRVYQALSAGGKVHMELGETPFAELYANFADRYGIHWMIYFGGNKSQEAGA